MRAGPISVSEWGLHLDELSDLVSPPWRFAYGLTLDAFDQAVCRSRGLKDHPEENANDEVRLRAPLLKVSQTAHSNAKARRELRLTKGRSFREPASLRVPATSDLAAAG